MYIFRKENISFNAKHILIYVQLNNRFIFYLNHMKYRSLLSLKVKEVNKQFVKVLVCAPISMFL